MDKKAFLAGTIAALTWGTVFVFGQISVQTGFHPLFVALLRFLSASIFLALYHVAKGGRFFLRFSDIIHFLILGASGIFGMNVFIFYSLTLTDSTITSLLMNANGFIIGLLGFFLLKEKISIMEIIGLIAGIGGCYLIFTQGDIQKISYSNLAGNTLAVLASFCWAFYSVWSKKTKVIDGYGAILSTLWASVSGTIMLAIAVLVAKVPLNFDIKNVLISVYLGIVPAGIGFTLWFYSINKLKTIIPGIIQFLAPLTTAVLAVILLKQSISIATIMGGFLIIAGVLLTLKKQ
ncbi:MAG TPA: DMT family transporter [bacterium]|nr:DMT family transporter [bacterium]HOL35183.1 DMT family transporter [bacterium]HPP08624.1 DMT family transporter [bacterium]